MAKITREDLKTIDKLADKLGSLEAAYKQTGLKGRSVRRWRTQIEEQGWAPAKKNNIPKIERAYQLNEKPYYELREKASDPSTKILKKYHLDKGIPSVSLDNYARYDKQRGKWFAGEFSNKYKDGEEISSATAHRIRGGAMNQIRKINKAKQFHDRDPEVERGDYEEAYARANQWQKDYEHFKSLEKDIAYQDKNGAWHLGEMGAKMLPDIKDTKAVKGSFVSLNDVRELFLIADFIPYSELEGLGNYLDGVYYIGY